MRQPRELVDWGVRVKHKSVNILNEGGTMKIHVRDDKKIVEVWMAPSERWNIDKLNSTFDEYNAKKYTIVLFESGDQDIFQNTLSLLLHNKTICLQ